MSTPTSQQSPDRGPDNAGELKERKRRRIYRACDYCRLRKSKCDGKMPCAGCVSIGHDCAYSDSQRSRRGGPRYIEELEGKIRNLEQVLRTINTEERIESAQNRELIAETLKEAGGPCASGAKESHGSPTESTDTKMEAGDQDELLETMIEGAGHLHLDMQHSDVGSQSQAPGLRALQRFRESLTQDSPLVSPSYSPEAGISRSSTSQPLLNEREGITPMPAKKTAIFFVDVAINHALCLMNFVHRPTIYEHLERVYESDNGLSPESQPRLALLYGLFALGALFSGSRIGAQEVTTPAGLGYFQSCQTLVDPMELRDIASLQALLCVIIFMQGTGMVTRSHATISAATSAAVRMGLHRTVNTDTLSPLDHEMRKRVFWVLRSMDAYITSMLGLPKTLADEDIDQDLPSDLDDNVLAGLQEATATRISVMTPVVAHTKLVKIMSKAVKDIYPMKKPPTALTYTYGVSSASVTEVEVELQRWFDDLSLSDNASAPSNSFEIRTQLLLRMAYGHAQMVLYRPFLHHILKPRTEGNIQIRAYACASACIKAAMQVVWLAEELDGRGLIHEAYWFTPYITSFAVITLYLFVLTAREDPTWQETRDTADRGRAIVLKMSNTNPMAEWCMSSLALSPFTHVESAEDFFAAAASASTPVSSSESAGTHRGDPAARVQSIRGQANVPLQSEHSLSLHGHPAFQTPAPQPQPQNPAHQLPTAHLQQYQPALPPHLVNPAQISGFPTGGSGELSAMPYVPLSPFAINEGTTYFDVQNPALAAHEVNTPYGHLGRGAQWLQHFEGTNMNWTPQRLDEPSSYFSPDPDSESHQ